MPNDKLAVLMTRYLTKEPSGQEEKELLNLLTTAPEHQYFIDLLSAYWHLHNAHRGHAVSNADEHFCYIIAHAQGPNVTPRSASASVDRVSLLKKVKFRI